MDLREVQAQGASKKKGTDQDVKKMAKNVCMDHDFIAGGRGLQDVAKDLAGGLGMEGAFAALGNVENLAPEPEEDDDDDEEDGVSGDDQEQAESESGDDEDGNGNPKKKAANVAGLTVIVRLTKHTKRSRSPMTSFGARPTLRRPRLRPQRRNWRAWGRRRRSRLRVTVSSWFPGRLASIFSLVRPTLSSSTSPALMNVWNPRAPPWILELLLAEQLLQGHSGSCGLSTSGCRRSSKSLSVSQ